MATKKITKTIATLLAERVREKLMLTSKEVAQKHQEKILASKEYAEFEKLRATEREIRKKIKNLDEKICDKYKTPMMKIRLNTMYVERPASVIINENEKVSVEAIRNTILLEDYFSDSSVSHEELVDNIVKIFTKSL